MMYLSRLILNPRSRRVQRDLVDPYELHRSMLSAFPPTLPPDERILYRQEVDGAAPRVLLQSKSEPAWGRLAQIEAYLLSHESKPYEPVFTAGQALRFRLLANPTRKVWNPQKENEGSAKRVGLYDEQAILDWLGRKAQQNGFELLECRVSRPDVLESARQKLRFVAVQFDGRLRVNDPGMLLSGMQNGIGSAKGFGFGLLSVAPGAA